MVTENSWPYMLLGREGKGWLGGRKCEEDGKGRKGVSWEWGRCKHMPLVGLNDKVTQYFWPCVPLSSKMSLGDNNMHVQCVMLSWEVMNDNCWKGKYLRCRYITAWDMSVVSFSYELTDWHAQCRDLHTARFLAVGAMSRDSSGRKGWLGSG